MAQFVQLQSQLSAFHAAGIGVVGLTYDAPELQQAFAEKNGIRFPFLSDINAASVKALGILNEDYEPGDDNYGIPHPGIFIIDTEMNIVGKIFVSEYSKRVTAESVLATAKGLLPKAQPIPVRRQPSKMTMKFNTAE
jgi:peroxiredoxin